MNSRRRCRRGGEGVANRAVRVVGPADPGAPRPLVELELARKVASLNGTGRQQDALHAHLFGAPRETTPLEVRAELLEIQRECCFYSGEPLRPSRAHVDHFIPWSRYALPTLENLVLASATENSRKSDHPPAAKFVRDWAAGLRLHHARLERLAERHGLEFAPRRSVAVAASLYRHLSPDAPLWAGGSSFELARPAPILLALHAALAGA